MGAGCSVRQAAEGGITVCEVVQSRAENLPDDTFNVYNEGYL